MAISTFPAPSTSSDNYVLISSVTPTAAASTVSFTGISGYRKLIFRTIGATLATAGYTTITFNSDTGANYELNQITGGATTNAQYFSNTNIFYNSGSTTVAQKMFLAIDNVNTTGIKTYTGFGGINATAQSAITGYYLASAAITTVTLTATTTFSGVGTVALYGVAA